MTSRERALYQQIHPCKLLIDFGTSFASAWLLWQGSYALAALVGFVPSLGITLWLMRFADLERLRVSWFGGYLALHMPGKIVAARVCGQLLVWAAALAHIAWLVPLGYFVIVLAWLNGLWDVKTAAASVKALS